MSNTAGAIGGATSVRTASNYNDRLKYLTVVAEVIEDILEEEQFYTQQYAQEIEEKRLKENLGADLIDVVSIASKLEGRFRVKLPPYVLDKKIGEIVDYIVSCKR